MTNTYTVTQAQSRLPELIRAANDDGRVLGITVRSETRAFLVPRERMEALLETLEILGNSEAMAAIRRSETGESRFHSLEDLEAMDWEYPSAQVSPRPASRARKGKPAKQR